MYHEHRLSSIALRRRDGVSFKRQQIKKEATKKEASKKEATKKEAHLKGKNVDFSNMFYFFASESAQ